MAATLIYLASMRSRRNLNRSFESGHRAPLSCLTIYTTEFHYRIHLRYCDLCAFGLKVAYHSLSTYAPDALSLSPCQFHTRPGLAHKDWPQRYLVI
jgi:hypothetical protein